MAKDNAELFQIRLGSDQALGRRVEQAGPRHVDAERHRLAHRGAPSGSKRAIISLLAEAQHGHGLGACRLDQFDRRHRFAEPGLRRRKVGIEAVDVLRPDAEHDLSRRTGRQAAATIGRPAVLPSARRHGNGGADRLRRLSSAGKKFIAGEPMKPATNMFAGRL